MTFDTLSTPEGGSTAALRAERAFPGATSALRVGVGRARSARHHGPMRIAFGTDEATAVTDHLKQHLRSAGHEVVVVDEGGPWPDVGRAVGELVASASADLGVVCCFTGTGVSIAANKVAGVRAALCTDAATASGARRWNDANVLALGLRLTTAVTGVEMLDAFLATGAEASEAANVHKLELPAR